MSSKIKISLAWQMMIGLALGIVVGALVDSSFAQTWLQPLGDLFIRLIRMVVVPLVLATIIAGAAGISDTSKLGRVAVKVLLVYAVTTGIAVACGLRDVMSELDGDVVLFAVPAEEYVEIDWRNAQRDEGRLKYLGGKQQLIAEGAFEDIDMAMQMHVASGDEFNLGASSNGFIGKLIEYHGRPAHAAFAPEEGINALNAAMMGVMGVNAIRETFRDQDHVRFHPIINAGGDLVNVIPDYVKMESYVRASNIDAMARYNKAVDRALRAGGDAIGAKCEIRNLPGYLPLAPDDAFREVLRDNAVELFGKEKVTLGEHSSGSTDMGDVSLLMPVIHPWVGCVDGVLHGADYELRDREAAFTRIPQALALTIVDLLADGAQKADEICTAFKPRLDRESYVAFMDDIR